MSYDPVDLRGEFEALKGCETERNQLWRHVETVGLDPNDHS